MVTAGEWATIFGVASSSWLGLIYKIWRDRRNERVTEARVAELWDEFSAKMGEDLDLRRQELGLRKAEAWGGLLLGAWDRLREDETYDDDYE